MLHRWLIAVLVLMTVLPAASTAWACSCYDGRSWEKVSRSDALFLGQLVEVDTVYVVQTVPWLTVPMYQAFGLRANRVALTFEVETWWQGSGERFVDVLTLPSSSSCGLPIPDPGQDMLIEGAIYKRTIFTSLCMRSLQIYDSEEAARLQKREDYRNDRILTRDSLQTHIGPGDEPVQSPTSWMWTFGSILAIAGVVVVWYVNGQST